MLNVPQYVNCTFYNFMWFWFKCLESFASAISCKYANCQTCFCTYASKDAACAVIDNHAFSHWNA